MKRYVRSAFLYLLLLLIMAGLGACAGKTGKADQAAVNESVIKRGSNDMEYVELTKINDKIWVHTTYVDYNGYRTPSNGVVAVTSKGLVLVDTPWNNPQTKQLIGLAKDTFGKDFSLAIVTHAHEDRIGGIDALLENKIKTVSTGLTADLAEKAGYKRPDIGIDADVKKFKAGDMELEVFYPGEGHTADNITVWFPEEKVLFGGCLVKSAASKNIGNTSDANVEQWPHSVNNVLSRYKDAEVVIPGHGAWGDTSLLKHTLELLGKN